MTDDVASAALPDALAFLQSLARDRVQPAEALARLAALRSAHTNVRVDLVWDASEYSGVIHYDVLIRGADDSTVSLAVCPTADTPWPLRGVRLASDHDLLRVNGETLKVRDAMECLDFLWDDARIMRSLVDLCLIDEAVKEYAIVPSAEHTQRALDAWRSARGLLAAADMHAWMDENGLTLEHLSEMLHARAEEYALREHVARTAGNESTVPASEFDVAHVARLRVRTRAHADLVAEQVRQRGLHAVMEEEYAARRLVALRHGHLASLRRRDLPSEHAALIFAASPDDVVGPLECSDGFDLMRLISIELADVTQPRTRDAMVDVAFERWLAARRNAALVEWYWGPR